MNEQSASSQFASLRKMAPALVCACAGGLLFQFFGNATQGYLHTRSLFQWWGIQWFDPAAETQHGLLIAVVAIWLFWRNLNQSPVPASPAQPAERSAAFALFSGLALHLAGFALQQTRVSIAGFLVFLWGVLALAGGRRWASAATFPLWYMLLAVPVSFVDTLGFHLRLAVASQASSLAQTLGVHLVRSGTQLYSPDGLFQYDVAAACSGIRSLVALLALALLIGYVGLRSWFPRLALAAACLPFVVVGNIARVLFIVLAAEKFGRGAGDALHEISGYVGFAVVLALLLGLLALLRRVGFAGGGDPRNAPAGPAQTRPGPWPLALSVVLASAAVAVLATGLSRGRDLPVAGIRLAAGGTEPADLPDFIGTDWIGRRVEVSAVEREVLPPDTGYARRNYVSLADVSRQVFVSIVLSGRDRTSIHRPELCLVGQGWSVTARATRLFHTPIGDVPVTLLHVEHATRDAKGASSTIRCLFAYWFVGADSLQSSHLGMQGRDFLDRLRHFRADRWAYVVAQTVVNQDNEIAAFAQMQEVVAQLWPLIRAGQPQP